MNPEPFLFSVVIPCFNEEDRLASTIERLRSWAPRFASRLEIVFVDDGSTDSTLRILRDLAATDSRVRVVEQPHVGAMHALIGGYHAALGEFVGNMEADCAADPEEFDRLVAFLSDYDVVVGSRQLRGDLGPIRDKKLPRRILSWGMSRLFTSLFTCGIRDPQIGFKAFKADVLREVLPLLKSRHDGIKAAESIVVAHALGYRVKEVPVRYRHDERSRLVPKWPHRVVWGVMVALLRLWIDSYREYRKGTFAKCPVRGALVLRALTTAGLVHSA
jgi:glycosyltransferase involved in cell wall biosynthesis